VRENPSGRGILPLVVGFVVRLAITCLGLWLAATWVPGISVEPGLPLVLAALLLGIVNAVVRPIAIVLTLPITLVTLGLFLWVINGLMLMLVSALLPGFDVAGLGPALLGALVVGLTGWLGNSFIGSSGRYEVLVVERGSRGE
jgi:putative membrane protein